MLAPWQPLLEWWFGWGTSAQAVADEKSTLCSASTTMPMPMRCLATWSSTPWRAGSMNGSKARRAGWAC